VLDGEGIVDVAAGKDDGRPAEQHTIKSRHGMGVAGKQLVGPRYHAMGEAMPISRPQPAVANLAREK